MKVPKFFKIPTTKNIINNKLESTKFSLVHIKKEDIDTFSKGLQEYADCYLIASLDALSKSTEGRRVLSQNISKVKRDYPFTTTIDEFQIVFRNVNNKKKAILVGEKEYDKNFSVFYNQNNKIFCAMKMAMNKIIRNNFFKKPFVCRLTSPFSKSFEYNRPSNFMYMFTGKKPIVIAENDINWNLKNYKTQVLSLLKKMSKVKNNNYTFVAGTGLKKCRTISNWHCVVIDSVDFKRKVLVLKNKRANSCTEITFDELINNFKFIVGYFNKNLK